MNNMNNKNNIESLEFNSLNEENVKAVYKMCDNNVPTVKQSLETFKKTTLESLLFDPSLTIVASGPEGYIVAFFMAVFRRSLVFRNKRRIAVLKFFVVEKEWRYKGLGTKIYFDLYERIKNSEVKCLRFEVMSSMPEYWFPGLDPRHTEAYFFLKKHGFKKSEERVNLCVNLDSIPINKPPDELKGFKVSRATFEDKKELVPIQFMSKLYQLSFWPEEIELSFANDPITTFIARDSSNSKIVGWATHTAHFPGSFGPTGVKKSLRGLGIGGILLSWCLWDIKQLGVKKAKILWVEDDTIYFYLKSKSAQICEFFWVMKKKI